MNSKMNPARVDREDERRMLPCRNFLDGFCPRGNRCRFYHPLPSSLPTVIRVPNLPSSFQQNNFGQFPVHTGPRSMFSLSPTHSSRSHIGLSPKLRGMGSPVASRYLGLNGLANNFGRGIAPPVSPTYSEYEMAYAQQMEIQKEKERRATAPPVLETEENVQNTVFSHIDWKEFLTPGARPPPPTHVPYMSHSPGKANDTLDSLETLIRNAGNAKITSPVNLSRAAFFADQLANEKDPTPQTSSKEDIPSPKAKEFTPQLKSNRMLSAKEELQMKVKQIAKELASEPAQHVQSLDTFFRNYTFQTIPTAPSSEQDLVGQSPREVKPITSDTSENGDAGFGMSKSETTTIMASGAFSSSGSGTSSEFSGDSTSSVESVKTECDEHDIKPSISGTE